MPNVEKIHITLWGNHLGAYCPPGGSSNQVLHAYFRVLLRDTWLPLERADWSDVVFFGFGGFGKWEEMYYLDGDIFCGEFTEERLLEISMEFYEVIEKIRSEELHLFNHIVSIDLADFGDMASALPDELIIKIAEYLIEPNQYVVFQRKQHLEKHPVSFPNDDFTKQPRPRFPLSKPQTSPLTLALFSPVLLAEYVKLLHKRAVFYFYHGGYLYNYIKPPKAIRESVLETRRSILFVRLVSWAMFKEKRQFWTADDPFRSSFGRRRPG
ncbi:hypothetical protein IWX90DRAFT_484483 [Phyllosticta citrichinensis]|uniref:Uncharacterized protein n=1 Tax=Phyllosticta citrichinensis TaxID=1130410 RepID=A0ABR1XZD1_9PEZI